MLTRAILLIAVIAVVDWRVETNVSLGFLYLFPMLMVGVSLNQWQIGIAAQFHFILKIGDVLLRQRAVLIRFEDK